MLQEPLRKRLEVPLNPENLEIILNEILLPAKPIPPSQA